jgi:hypothetical protein
MLSFERQSRSRRIALSQVRAKRMYGVGWRMCRSIEYEGYREAGCGMLVVEAMEGLAAVVVGCSLFSPLSPRSLPTPLNGTGQLSDDHTHHVDVAKHIKYRSVPQHRIALE